MARASRCRRVGYGVLLQALPGGDLLGNNVLAQAIQSGGIIGLLTLIITAIVVGGFRGWYMWSREYNVRIADFRERLAAKETECAEWKALADELRGLTITNTRTAGRAVGHLARVTDSAPGGRTKAAS